MIEGKPSPRFYHLYTIKSLYLFYPFISPYYDYRRGVSHWAGLTSYCLKIFILWIIKILFCLKIFWRIVITQTKSIYGKYTSNINENTIDLIKRIKKEFSFLPISLYSFNLADEARPAGWVITETWTGHQGRQMVSFCPAAALHKSVMKSGCPGEELGVNHK